MSARYVSVVHHFWMGHKRFDVSEIEAASLDEAIDKAQADAYRKADNFNDTAATVIELSDGERLVRSRRLTLRERLLGYARP